MKKHGINGEYTQGVINLYLETNLVDEIKQTSYSLEELTPLLDHCKLPHSEEEKNNLVAVLAVGGVIINEPSILDTLPDKLMMTIMIQLPDAYFEKLYPVSKKINKIYETEEFWCLRFIIVYGTAYPKTSNKAWKEIYKSYKHIPIVESITSQHGPNKILGHAIIKDHTYKFIR